jgi:hypothetical protein
VTQFEEQLGAGEADPFLRLWTPHRMAYIKGANKPADADVDKCPFCAIAGAGIAAHLHQHVVPRWGGDTNFMPVVGRTKVLPQLLGDTRNLIAMSWPRPQADQEDHNSTDA